MSRNKVKVFAYMGGNPVYSVSFGNVYLILIVFHHLTLFYLLKIFKQNQCQMKCHFPLRTARDAFSHESKKPNDFKEIYGRHILTERNRKPWVCIRM